jgi:signal transduction histidine kinase
MQSLGRRSSSWRWLVVAIIVLAELGLGDSVQAADEHKRVLVLYSTRRDSQISIIGEAELPRILEVGLGRDLDYYSEFLDVARFPDQTYREAFDDFVRQKYQGTRFDAIIAMGDIAVEFFGENRDGVFRDTPLVFLANNPTTHGGANSTGLIVDRNFSATLSLIEGLQPGIRNLFVVSGAADADKVYERQARAQFESFQSRLTINYLSGLSSDELERRLAALPEGSAVYYLLATQDGDGQKLHPLEYVDRVTAAASAPTYCWVDSAMDHGIVGGSLYNQREATDRVAQLALRVLRGERADTIATSTADLTSNQVDWRQLRRWGLSESRLPAGTAIRFREPGIWDRYRVYLLGATALLLAQSGLIVGLLIQRARRRQAEGLLRGSQAELRTSLQRIRDLGGRLLNAQETERSRIARELHDDISQQMVLLEIDLAILSGSVDGEAKKLATDVLDRAQSVARGVHDLSHRLHPAKLRLIGLVSALQGLQRELSQSGVAITFSHDNVPSVFPRELTLCLFRVVQEALQNAIKYSHAAHVSVDLHGGSDGLALSIEDDGVGFDVATAWGKGLGLISMTERLEAIGGTLEIRSRIGVGTRLEVTVPLSAIAAEDQVMV